MRKLALLHKKAIPLKAKFQKFVNAPGIKQ